MKTFDFTPLYRSTVGFDRMFDLLDSTVRPDWPPYDIEKLSDDAYRINMAVAGFGPSDIEIVQEGGNLTITGRKELPEGKGQLLHRGIASQSFRQVFSLADHVRVAQAGLVNGLLSIELVREVPEQLKPRKIEIVQTAPELLSSGTQKQINQTARDGAKAA
ncbi:MAG: Hsp20 family protein [Candidatus Saccharibacteria bacterium]|nr:Hsp20 family protein [Pseudorhodobacter sp.]